MIRSKKELKQYVEDVEQSWSECKEKLEKQEYLLGKIINSAKEPYFILDKQDNVKESIVYYYMRELKSVPAISFLSTMKVIHFKKDEPYFVYQERYNGEDYTVLVDKETNKSINISGFVEALQFIPKETDVVQEND